MRPGCWAPGAKPCRAPNPPIKGMPAPPIMPACTRKALPAPTSHQPPGSRHMVKKSFSALGEAQHFGGKEPVACRHGGHVDARSLALAQVCAFAGHCAVIGTGCCVCRGAPPVPLPGGLLTPSTALGPSSSSTAPASTAAEEGARTSTSSGSAAGPSDPENGRGRGRGKGRLVSGICDACH